MVGRTLIGVALFTALLAAGVLLSEQQAAARGGCHGGLLRSRCDGKLGAGLHARCDGVLARRCHGGKCDGLLGRRCDGGKCHGGRLGRRCHGGCAGGKVEAEATPAAPETPPAPPAPPAASNMLPHGYIPVAFRS